MTEMHDDFLDNTMSEMDKQLSDEQLQAMAATEEQHPGAIGALRRISGSVYSSLMGFMSSKGMSIYTNMAKEVALDEAERRFAEILQRVFWGFVKKSLGNCDIRFVQFLINNPYGRAATMAVIAVPVSALLASRVSTFEEAGNMRYAKICMFLSRVISKMALIDGMAAFSIDKLVDKAINSIIGMAEKEGANLEEAASNISDQQVHEAGKNHRKMRR